ncbi:MAG TPA: hypothetical protein VNN17_03100, partial [Terriglobia bacterium]|nr:hypothetical protein [Terriglobia bacterium]
SLDEFASELGWRYAAARQIPLARLEAPFTEFSSAQAFVAYGESLAAVQMIHDRYGDDPLLDLLRALRQGQSMAQALQSVLRLSYPEMERELAAYLAHRYGR